MNPPRLLTIITALIWLYTCPVSTRAGTQDPVTMDMEQTTGQLDRFTRKCEKRTQKALQRMERYEKKLMEKASKQSGDKVKPIGMDSTLLSDKLNKQEPGKGLGKEPLLDSLRTAYGFAQATQQAPNTKAASEAKQSISRAQQQLDITQRTKAELQQRKDKWKAELKNHPEYARTVGKMEKESYYYTAQIREYRKVLRDPSLLDDKLMTALRGDPRWSSYLASLPSPPQDPAKMQPKQLVQQMMQSQAAAIDPDAMKLISDAKKKGTELLGELSESATGIGNMDNATQVPGFTPNPYKTKTFWERIDVGFDLEFDGKTYFLPSCGVAGAQLSFNFDKRFSSGILANYRFGMGEIKHIHFSHQGAGYGVFINGMIWKGFGAQAGFERNWRVAVAVPDGPEFPSGWTSAALLGITKEYSIGKKAKGTLAVFYDFLHNQHTPQSNALVWRMGWKF